MTGENDIVLIHMEDKPVLFARIESISADSKKNWYHVKLLFLQIPLQIVTWILKDIYIDGAEFTMNGKKMRLEKAVCPEDPILPEEVKSEKIRENPGGAKVISLADLKK